MIAASSSLEAEQLAVALARFHLAYTFSSRPFAWRQFSRLQPLTRSGLRWIVAYWRCQHGNETRPSASAVKLEATTAQQRFQQAHAQALAQRRVEIGWWACPLVVHDKFCRGGFVSWFEAKVNLARAILDGIGHEFRCDQTKCRGAVGVPDRVIRNRLARAYDGRGRRRGWC